MCATWVHCLLGNFLEILEMSVSSLSIGSIGCDEIESTQTDTFK